LIGALFLGILEGSQREIKRKTQDLTTEAQRTQRKFSVCREIPTNRNISCQISFVLGD
jgi:hypothetical protein